MKNQAAFWLPQSDGLIQRRKCKLRVNLPARCPANNAARVQILNSAQIRESSHGWDIGKVS